MIMKRFLSRSRRDADLASEIEAHLELEAEENRSRGLSPQEARRQAYVKFGSPRRVRESEWESNTMKLIDDAWHDLKYAVRTLARARFYCCGGAGHGLGNRREYGALHRRSLRPAQAPAVQGT